MPILVTMEKYLQRTAKECDVYAGKIKIEIEDELLKEITNRFVDLIDDSQDKNVIIDAGLYYLLGYMLHARPSVTECGKCKESVRCDKMELSPDFSSYYFIAIVSRGYSIYVTV